MCHMAKQKVSVPTAMGISKVRGMGAAIRAAAIIAANKIRGENFAELAAANAAFTIIKKAVQLTGILPKQEKLFRFCHSQRGAAAKR